MLFLTLAFCWGIGTGNCQAVIAPQPFLDDAKCEASAKEFAREWLKKKEAKWRLRGWTCGPPPKDEDDL
jgi:hypothetical protein